MDTSLLSEHLSEASVRDISRWLEHPLYAEYRDELLEMIREGRWRELEDAFFQVIEFGTGGRRGTTGIGSNRINKVTIGESAQALCAYAASADQKAADKGIVIACDTRLSSPELSRYTARVCAANGFKTYIFEDFRSTPELSFAVRHLRCAAGIVISASHNPPADNGFKAYWNDGAQLVAPHDKGVLALAEGVEEINVVDYDQAVADGLITVIGKEVDEAYVAAAVAEAVGENRTLRIAYSPLHGAGQTNVLPVLQAAGFDDIVTVPEQMVPDGNFPTVENNKPNPEEKPANDRVVALMMASEADIAITNDPDADRFGAMVRHGQDVIYLSGNQSAVVAIDYILRKMQQAGELTSDHYIAKTIVTSDMLGALANHYGVKLYTNMLIGFKYIGELIRNKEASAERFVAGAEESFGMLKGTYARDKDGVSGALALAECAAELKAEGKTLYDRLLELYAEHGLYTERLDTMYRLGADGFNEMQTMMAGLRQNPPIRVGQHEVTAISDYKSLQRRDLKTGQVEAIDCAAGNVVVLELGDTRRRFTIRPSGTESKIKFYVQWFEDAGSTVDIHGHYEHTMEDLEGLSKELEGVLLGYVAS